MTPHEALALANEITAHMSRLATLDLSPLENGADIDATRADVEDATRALLSYLVASDNFTPITEEAGAVQIWDIEDAPASNSQCALIDWDLA